MRSSLLFLFGTIGFGAFAQDWALINPAYKYNYSNDGTDTIINQIYVTHIDTLGVDSFRYELNPIAKVCDTCTAPGLFLLLNQPQFMQRKVDLGPSVWHFHDPGSMVILPQAGLGETWVFDTLAGITATISAEDIAQVFGDDVPRKVIGLSDGNTIVISGIYGVLRWNDHELIGMHGPDVGTLIPSLDGMFPYQAGDVVEYSTGDAGTGGISTSGHGRRYKFTVDTGDPAPVAMVFSGTMVDHRWNWESTGSGSTFTYGHETTFGPTWTAGIPELPWAELLFSYPGQLVRSRHSDQALWSGQDTLACIAQHGIDAQGRYTLSCQRIPWPGSSGEQGHFMSLSFDQLSATDPVPTSVENYCNDPECGVLYTEGTGLNWLRGDYFERNEWYVLEGSVVNGDTVGTIHTDDQIIALSVAESGISQPAHITPNPASDHLFLSSGTPATTYAILDLHGRILATHKITATNERINLQQLQPGAYLLKIEGMPAERFMIMR